MPNYEAQITLPSLVRRDSQNPFSVSIKYKSNDIPVIPDNICSQLRDRDGCLIHTFETTINPTTGKATNGAPVDILEGRFVALRFEEVEEEEQEQE